MKVIFENEKKVDSIQLLEMKQELCSKYDLRVTKVIEKVTEKLKFFEEHQTWQPYLARACGDNALEKHHQKKCA